MKELLTYLLENITGSKDFTIETNEEGDRIDFDVKVNPEIIGLIIGKGGNTIKSITTILRVKGKLENKLVNVNVSEK